MAKFQSLPILVVLFQLAASFLGVTAAAETSTFVVEGKVYCDNCRAGFETTITEYIAGAKVRLVCRNATTHETLHTTDGETNKQGTYKLKVTHDHQHEICEVNLVSSPVKDCSEIKGGRDKARVVITDNSGISTNVRYANSLGFLKAEPLPICGQLLAQYALGEE